MLGFTKMFLKENNNNPADQEGYSQPSKIQLCISVLEHSIYLAWATQGHFFNISYLTKFKLLLLSYPPVTV